MLKALIIHHDNIPDIEDIQTLKFCLKPNIDNYISINILEQIKEKEFDILFIKDNLSTNYLDFYGLRLAHHIRLTENLGDRRFVPIVILSDLDIYTLNRLSKLSRVLFSQNIHLAANSKEAIIQHREHLKAKDIDIEKFLEVVEIEKPEQSSHHDIANEWAIYRWATLLDVKSEAIEENYQTISHSLYFKHLQNSFLQKETDRCEIKEIKSKGKILYIDDEWHKGWKDILEKFFSHSNITLECHEGSYESSIKLQSEIKKRVLEFDPDIVLLDLRLTPNDKKQNEIEGYTGVAIAKLLKEINPGIQIIMITATSKSMILEKLYEYGISGYIKKEHPDDVGLDSIENIEKLYGLVESGLREKYLKEMWSIQKEIVGLGFWSDELAELKNSVDKIFHIAHSDIADKEIFCALSIFRCLEIVINFYIREGTFDKEKKKCDIFWRESGEKIDLNYNSVESKLEVICTQKLDMAISKQIEKIVCFRNHTIHAGVVKHHCKKVHITKLNRQHLLNWFKMLKEIVVQMDKQP